VAVVDFIYYSQLQEHTSDTLVALQAALDMFHENKDIFVRAGICEHFNIPKIHQMLHYIDAIKSRSSADGYNSESPERLHIDFAKHAYRASNKREYVCQMTIWLGHQEAVAQFTAYLNWLSNCDLTEPDPEPDPKLADNIGGEEDPAVIMANKHNMANSRVSHTISIKPGFPHHDLTTITNNFKAENFSPLLTTFICHAYPPPKSPVLPNAMDRFDLFKVLSVRRPDFKATGCYKSVNYIRATPAVPGRLGKKDVDAHFDTVLV
jgi:hypothetical protein